MEEFKILVFGEASLAWWAAAFVFAAIGIIFSLKLDILKRDKASERSPVGFSWAFFFSDNAWRIIVSGLLTFVCLRFAPDIIGKEATMYSALLIGLALDKLAELLKNKNVLPKQSS